MIRLWDRFSAAIELDRLTLRAAALTYLSSLALVPLGGLALSVLGLLGLRGQGVAVRQFIMGQLGLSPEIARWVGGAMAQANAAEVGGVSGLLLVGSAGGLLLNVEATFNEIWGVERPRSIGRRLLFCAVVLAAGPLCLGASLAVTSAPLRSVVMRLPILGWPLAARPILLVFLGLFALYALAPNAKVRLGAAAVAAAVAAPAWEIAKHVYGVIAAGAFQRNALIYGSLAAIPALLLWIQVSWLIVLGGARLARSLELSLFGRPG
ncbi:MAG: YihY/virulence factor BrkB family protein [Deltaproteobacteria bacterium]